ncbi:MAG: alpha-L-glutamate ligase-like protein [Legionellales bacterium]|nr:alpha-L-glutamate ligase-like protein [Legionellales bacterium]
MWRIFSRLKKGGVLSINQRNSDYVLRYNRRLLYPLVDDKLKTKRLALQAGIAVPPLYELIDSEHQIRKLEEILAPYSDFVIKPARGAGGDGIIVISEKVLGRYRQINGRLVTLQELSYHLSCLLSGAYSLGGHPDYAIIEHRVIVDPVFADVSYEGAIGIGVNIATGLTLGGVFHNETIDVHPDTLKPIVDIQVPFWDKILEIAASCYELTGLGYLGVDIVLDKVHGPLMLELNARPGLNIQIANREGALSRYRTIEAHAALGKEPIHSRVAFSQQQFAKGI